MPYEHRMLFTLPFLGVALLLLPALGWLGFRQSTVATPTDEAGPSVRALALQVLIAQALVGGFATLALLSPAASVSWRSSSSPAVVLGAVDVVATALGLAWMEARRPLGPQDAVRRSMRRVAASDPLWISVTLVAGTVEEFAYRGVLVALLARPLGMPAAVLLSAVAFGLAHVASGVRALWFSIGFALAMQGLVHVGGGLAVAIAAHASYDLIAAWLARRVATHAAGAG